MAANAIPARIVDPSRDLVIVGFFIHISSIGEPNHEVKAQHHNDAIRKECVS
jgi:hypothetical protein